MNLYRQFCNIPPPKSPRTKLREVMFSVVSIGQSLCQSFCSQGVPMLLHMGMFKPVHLGTSTQPQPPALPTQGSQHLRLKKPSCYFWLLKRSAYGKKEVISVNSLDHTIVLHFPSKCYKCYVTGQHYLTKYIQKIGKCLVCRSSQENRNSITHSHF